MNKAYFAVLAAFAFATLLMVGTPARSVQAQEPGQLLLEKDCVGFDEGEFDFDLNVTLVGDPDSLAALDDQIDDVNSEFGLDLDRGDVIDIIESEFSQEVTLACGEDPSEIIFEGEVDLSGPVAFDLADILEGITVGPLDVFGLNDLGLGLELEIDELDEDQLGPDIETSFSEECAGGIVDLADVLETGVHCVITNTQPTFADIDIEIEKICENADTGTFGVNLAIAVDLSEAPDELLEILVEAGLLDDTAPVALDIDDVLGEISCGETESFVIGEPLRMLLAASLIFDLDYTVTLEEVAVDEGVEVTFGGTDCDADGLVLDVSDTGIFADLQAPIAAAALELDSPADLLLFLSSVSSEAPELSCEITNTFGLSSLTVHKDCIPANTPGTFDIEVSDDSGVIDSASLGCDDSLEVTDLTPGEYTLSETDASEGLENFTTFIVCTDGTSAEEVSLQVDVSGDTECWVLNYDDREVMAPQDPPTLPEINVIVNNENVNTNTNENTNINENEDTNNNTQNNTQTTGDVIVSADGPNPPVYLDDDKDHRGGGTGNIRPPNTGSAGLADTDGNAFSLPVALIAVAAFLGTVSLAALKLARAEDN